MKIFINLVLLICQGLAIWFAWQHNQDLIGLAVCLTAMISIAIGFAIGRKEN